VVLTSSLVAHIVSCDAPCARDKGDFPGFWITNKDKQRAIFHYLLMYCSHVVNAVTYALQGDATDCGSVARYAVSFRLHLGSPKFELTFVAPTRTLTD